MKTHHTIAIEFTKSENQSFDHVLNMLEEIQKCGDKEIATKVFNLHTDLIKLLSDCEG